MHFYQVIEYQKHKTSHTDQRELNFKQILKFSLFKASNQINLEEYLNQQTELDNKVLSKIKDNENYVIEQVYQKFNASKMQENTCQSNLLQVNINFFSLNIGFYFNSRVNYILNNIEFSKQKILKKMQRHFLIKQNRNVIANKGINEQKKQIVRDIK
ncbi:hypothetical protein ABPG74_017518 [Tetrahymena malaccensis]